LSTVHGVVSCPEPGARELQCVYQGRAQSHSTAQHAVCAEDMRAGCASLCDDLQGSTHRFPLMCLPDVCVSSRCARHTTHTRLSQEPRGSTRSQPVTSAATAALQRAPCTAQRATGTSARRALVVEAPLFLPGPQVQAAASCNQTLLGLCSRIETQYHCQQCVYLGRRCALPNVPIYGIVCPSL